MDRSTEPHNAPGYPTQSSGPVSAEDSHQESWQPPQAPSSRPINQPVLTFAQNAPQTAPTTTGTRGISSPISQDHQADAPEAPAGLTHPPWGQPPRRGATLPPRAPSSMPGREGYNENGTYRLAEPPLALLSPTRRYNSVMGSVTDSEKHAPGVRTLEERLRPTLDNAESEKASAERKGMQVVLGALVTGLSSALAPGKAGVTTAILGGVSTVVASYLARMRGSGEPERSLARAKELGHFIREAKAFQLDFGYITDDSKNAELEGFRKRLERLLGNTGG
ncbi:hypothetical protein HWV62_20804 [Athelia sp. TMB]|nr:hypothetical protein HWV62_20804 [Athelia sp. TMB]